MGSFEERISGFHFDTPLEKLLSRRSGDHANAVFKSTQNQQNIVVKLAENPNSEIAKRAIRKEASFLNHLSPQLHPYFPKILASKGDHDPAIVYEFIDSVAMHVTLNQHPSPAIWEPMVGMVYTFLSTLQKTTRSKVSRSLRIDTYLRWLTQHFPESAADIQTWAHRWCPDIRFSIKTCSVHGDFNPWNLIIQKSDFQLKVVDWEDSSRAGCPLWDAFYFVIVAQWIAYIGETEETKWTNFSKDILITRKTMVEQLSYKLIQALQIEAGLTPKDVDTLLAYFLLHQATTDLRMKRKNADAAKRWLFFMTPSGDESLLAHVFKMNTKHFL